MASTRSITRNLLLASAVAGLFLSGAVAPAAHADEGNKVRCYGINACKGKGDCGGKGHSCAGQNACRGKGYLKLDKETCLKIQGARLTPEAPKGNGNG